MLTVTEAARYLTAKGYKCDRSRVHRLINKGAIPVARIGHVFRVEQSALDALLTPKTIEPAAGHTNATPQATRTKPIAAIERIKSRTRAAKVIA